MSGILAAFFPVLIVGLVVVVIVLSIRLDRRMSRGASGAGPRLPHHPPPVGQARTAWELQAIEDQLRLAARASGPAVPRHDLTATVNRLISAAGLDDARDQLPITADLGQLAAAITRIEQQLGLPALDPKTTEGPDRR